ncbi:phosphoribosylanthranilate isomerase [Saccharibacillus deserti]|uniref:phosphoribosylanthranilate isomerase n=1 Tax=Saccharibacillus deserti TaxID=1634444 RepID=UPI001554F958|nr:phosphoribosylanthranilate isomerase [Saccharibacillus deserti]
MKEREERTNKGPVIKICGIRTPEAVRKAAELGVDYIGLVFAPSRRRVDPAEAAVLIGELNKAPKTSSTERVRPKVAGVFVNPSLDELKRTLAAARLDVVQLHGQESPDFCREVRERFGGEVFKSIPIGGEDADEGHAVRAERMCESYRGAVDALLLDTHDPLYGGGSGRTFNWEIIPLYQQAAEACGLKLFVAGGLTESNAGELVRNYAPDGIDVSSGVETDGHKDIQKMTLFVERAVLS